MTPIDSSVAASWRSNETIYQRTSDMVCDNVMCVLFVQYSVFWLESASSLSPMCLNSLLYMFHVHTRILVAVLQFHGRVANVRTTMGGGREGGRVAGDREWLRTCK